MLDRRGIRGPILRFSCFWGTCNTHIDFLQRASRRRAQRLRGHTETISQRYERASTLITNNLPFDEWTEIFGSERLTGALLDRITHHVHIMEMNADSYRLKQSRRKRA